MGDVERSDLDRVLLANANRSLGEISGLTGLSEGDVAVRLSELFEERGVLYDLYRERALLEDLWGMKEELRGRFSDSDERNAAGLANAWRQVVGLVLDRFDKARERNREDLFRVDEFHAELLSRALFKSVELLVERLGVEFEDVSVLLEGVVGESFRVIEGSVSGG